MKGLFVGLVAVLPLLSTASAADEPDARWLQKAQHANLSSLRKNAYEQIAKLSISKLTMWMNPGGFDILTIKAGSDSPAETLYNMGLDVLPVLIEALDDTTPTTVVEPDRRLIGSKTWKVNELAARLIGRIAQHNFVIGDFPNERLLSWDLEQHPDSVPQFKKQILDWYAQNRNRSLEDRKIADVSDSWFRNRLDAVEWLGEHKILKAKSAIVQYINKTLTSKEKNSLLDAEAAESALALGQIGDKSTLPVVQRVCRYLANGLKQYGVTGSMDLYTLFQAHKGCALLGEKSKTLQELKSLYEQSAKRIEPSTRREYQERMQKAADW